MVRADGAHDECGLLRSRMRSEPDGPLPALGLGLGSGLGLGLGLGLGSGLGLGLGLGSGVVYLPLEVLQRLGVQVLRRLPRGAVLVRVSGPRCRGECGWGYLRLVGLANPNPAAFGIGVT